MKKTKELSFEDAMAQLEATVKEMESGDLGLDELLSKFETGIGLLRSCEKKLGEAQGKIEILSQKAIADPAPQENTAIDSTIEADQPPIPDPPPLEDEEGSLF